MRIAVLLACYNRKELTQRCLNSLQDQFVSMNDKQFDVYVYDDCSTDGTYEILMTQFPQVSVIRGKGNAYWCKSMHYLMKIAVEKEYDFYMMINDDVYFSANAVKQVFDSYNKAGKSCGVVGALKSAYSQKCTYGGRNQYMELLTPNGQMQQCIWANWNCFLIDANIVKKVGIIDGKYRHAMGDWEYSHRMIKRGFSIYITADYIGECENNSEKGTYRDESLKKRERLKKLFSPKGIPFGSYLRYTVKVEGVFGFFWALYKYCGEICNILLSGKQ